MPRLRGGGYSVTNGIGELADTLLQYRLKQKLQDRESQLVGDRQQELSQQNAMQRILSRASEDPTFANRLRQSGTNEIMGIPVDTFLKSNTDVAGGLSKDIAGAKTLNDLGSKQGLFDQFRTQSQNGGRGITDLNALTNTLNTYDAQAQQLRANTAEGIQNEGTKAQQVAYGSGIGTNQAANETAGDVLTRDADKIWTEGLTKNSLANTTLPDEINRDNQKESGTRSGKVTTAGQMAFAQGRGQAAGANPYENPTTLYDVNGLAHAIKFNPDGTSTEVKIPDGLGRQPRPLGQQELDQVSALNSAEVEGVKVLQELHQAGLDQSNNPLDPRWQKFVVGKLGMAPADWQKADIQQRTAYVNALLTRSLMGARPSKYVAELIQAHLPKGSQTGMQLTHVLTNVLEEGAGRRKEIGALTGREMNNPVSGATFEQWKKILEDEASKGKTGVNAPAKLTPGLDSILRR